MDNLTLTKIEKEDFEQLFLLMSSSFPPEEYRPKEKQLALLDDDDYCATVLKENGKVVAFIAVWRLKGFAFAEHFAVEKEKRNNGLGSKFLKEYLKSLPLPLVLEVENLDDEIPKRRIDFYKRLGFIETDICYDQPNFHNSDKIIPLKIMFHPNGHKLDIKTVKDEIFKNIYKRAKNGERI
ncbi:MAG: GNAT family N-acetyltransferase [Ruminococcaceae bacterium]|nr:GNAT family N-acetyltransferase [Oscillospiraceae bacterium]